MPPDFMRGRKCKLPAASCSFFAHCACRCIKLKTSCLVVNSLGLKLISSSLLSCLTSESHHMNGVLMEPHIITRLIYSS